MQKKTILRKLRFAKFILPILFFINSFGGTYFNSGRIITMELYETFDDDERFNIIIISDNPR